MRSLFTKNCQSKASTQTWGNITAFHLHLKILYMIVYRQSFSCLEYVVSPAVDFKLELFIIWVPFITCTASRVVDKYVPIITQLGVEDLRYHLSILKLIQALHLSSNLTCRNYPYLVVLTYSRFFTNQLRLHTNRLFEYNIIQYVKMISVSLSQKLGNSTYI
jgi:hypothetical protein